MSGRLGNGHAQRGLTHTRAALKKDRLVQLQTTKNAHHVLCRGGRLQGKVELGRNGVRSLPDGEWTSGEMEFLDALVFTLVCMGQADVFNSSLGEECLGVEPRTLFRWKLSEQELEALSLHLRVLVHRSRNSSR